MSKADGFKPIKIKLSKKSDLPAGLISIVYFCTNCKAKNTYGGDYFVEVGVPDKCPNCSTSYVQDDQVARFDDEDDETFLMKRDDLRRKRGEEVPVEAKPDSPEEIKQARIEQLAREIRKLKGEEDQTPGIRLGP